MGKRRIFYSFHFDNDVMRVQQIRNIGSIEGNKPVSANEWETVKKGGDKAIKNWIEQNLYGKSCLIVLVGSETATRKWVQYEIGAAWDDYKGVFGIYIHNINCPRNGKCKQGNNPFRNLYFTDSNKRLSDVVKCYNPKASNAYNDIADNIEDWIEEAIEIREDYE
jgi:hypothetical protein